MLPILFHDEHLVVVHKPAGLLVHRTAIDARERRFAVQMLRRQIGRRVYPVHRLDKGTSGVLLFALQPDVGRIVNAMFAAQQVRKTYLAIVRGYPAESGTVDHPLRQPRDPRSGDTTPVSRPAITHFRRLATIEINQPVDRYPTSRYALVELQPVTGRHHQLRLHMKHLAHPIIGDATYGKGAHNRLFHSLFACRRLLLACVELRLDHPVTGAPLICTAPLAADFCNLLGQLGCAAQVPRRWLPSELDAAV